MLDLNTYLENITSFLRLNRNYLIALLVITLTTYINILPNKLFYDDEELIYKNVYVQNLSFLPKYFTENMIAGAGKTSNMYRPILLTSFAVDHLSWGNTALGYHFTSIFLHALNSVLIFTILLVLFKNQFMAFLSSLFFIVHPIQSESIAYASGRTDPLYSFFLLSAILLFISILADKITYRFKYYLALSFFILSLLSKETAVILPLILILVYFTYIRKKEIDLYHLLKISFPFFLIDFFYVFLRLTILNFSNTLNFYPASNTYSSSLLVRFYTFSNVFFTYLSILIYPKELIMFRNVPIINSPLYPSVFAFILIAIVVTFLSFKIWRKNKIFLFSILWFLITILPVSGIIPINNILAEHYLYLPSISFFLPGAYLLTLLWKKCTNMFQKSFLVIPLTCLFIILTSRTILRNFDWHDPITFYTMSLVQSPWQIPMRHNLAMAYSENGQSELAINEYKKIIATNDIYPHTHHNLANIYKEIGKNKEAEEEYRKAISLDPNFQFSYYGLADLYNKMGEQEKLDEITTKIQMLFKNN
ncbi:hypothetical protein COV53_02465 [Candidatus Gottesmanbacteria bacterium CG11_big_fil_rev_8_21_14_0_20_37_11]|uniref:Uncharacterized protein n=3 Tax=Candidatus Gottesmaniibacteriota TaxID=1752720 RepID=A0A2M7RSI1_9BACT|nr:MAG: hypothetical protein AUJ73_03965 [Candidatus Gottesmanbacteria bacterium CG1_02_37_22]PIP32685.1 MAG: hypothetical protein COX23_03355 [Candidatus Gottesmanbacteria bacterium CG23_combo_of_CG06-09_8_20_14_all_37_19]PIR08564.1 MAG: hypothetical protein COV53_02465 [Candidatus Gottesmanbacteria bacterium CG11_big_fil_rev_8_21_14_0_20_37_11]PIZ03216.1 MAG: hypothetical protein COY59_00785 [Candidatus Gottesmanbacteria bacterium CG_4_10_14_0_8_um_filter_37_24]